MHSQSLTLFAANNETKPRISILVVDDNPMNRMLILQWLSTETVKNDPGKNVNWVIVEASRGQEAVNLSEEHIKNYNKNFDLIVMDYEMPTKVGDEIKNGGEAIGAILDKEVNLIENDKSIIALWSSLRNIRITGVMYYPNKPASRTEFMDLFKNTIFSKMNNKKNNSSSNPDQASTLTPSA